MKPVNEKYVVWSDYYSVGNHEIDMQHKKLFETINELNSLLANKILNENLKKIFDDLTNYIKDHFSTEEKYFDLFHYQFTDEHKQKHKEFIEKIKKLKNKTASDQLAVVYRLKNILHNWLIDHIQDEDFKYRELFSINKN